MFRVIKRVSIYLFSMPVSLAQWRGEIGAFYNNRLAISKISIVYLLLSPQYGSIICRLDLIKLLFLTISLILNGIMFFHFKKCKNNNLKIGVYLFTTIYLLNISNLLEYLWVASRIISLSVEMDINPGPTVKSVFFDMLLEFKQHISSHVHKSFSFISIHFCPQIWYYLPLRNLSHFQNPIWWRKFGHTWIQSHPGISPI